jgi:membrane-associated phospholipid phosphatase
VAAEPRRPDGLDPRLRFLAVSAVVVAVAHLADGWVFRHLTLPGVYGHDWGRMLRVMGYYPTWMLAALAVLLHDWVPRTRESWRSASRRARRLLWSPAVGGILAEALKLVVRRERPTLTDGAYVFRAWADGPFSSKGFGMPSSHTAVAFGAAAMLARLFPRARLVWYGVAAGCGLTRVASGAHFFSDVVVGALIGWLSAWLIG